MEADNDSEIDLSEAGLTDGLHIITAEYHGHTRQIKLLSSGRK
jgi:hypothetical protein